MISFTRRQSIYYARQGNILWWLLNSFQFEKTLLMQKIEYFITSLLVWIHSFAQFNYTVNNGWSHSRQQMLSRSWFNVGPSFTKPARHQTSVACLLGSCHLNIYIGFIFHISIILYNTKTEVNRPIRAAVSTFFRFGIILLDWLCDFFPSSTKRDGKNRRQFFVE